MLHGHGGDIYGLARGLARPASEILDFSANVSPLPLPVGLREHLIAHLDEIRSLPEVDSLTLREALAVRYGLETDEILVGAGTTEWIYALPRLLAPEAVVVPLPTYADYADAARLAGIPVRALGPWPYADPGTTATMLSALEAAAGEQARCVVYLCNPNNPTGRFVEPAVLRALIEAVPRATWVVDEAYAPFVAPDEASSLLASPLPDNLLVLRSFSKIYGVPGLRLGCAAGAGALMRRLMIGARPWAVSRLAQVAGVHLLGETGYEEAVRAFCREERPRFLKALEGVPFLRAIPGATHFILFEAGPPWQAARLTDALCREGVLIRNCANFVGMRGEFVRMSLRAKGDNDRLVGLLADLSGKGGGCP